MITMLGILIALAVPLVVAIGLPLLSFIRASRALSRVEALERQIAALTLELRAARGQAQAASARPVEGEPVPAVGETPAAEPPPVSELAEVAAPPPLPVAAPEPPPPQPVPEAARAAAAAPAPVHESLETRVGSRWLLYAGVALLVLGTSYLVKHAIDRNWISEPVRIAIGFAFGLVLLTAGGRFARAGYGLFGQLLSGAGLAAFYLSAYAAFALYALIGRGAAFASMIAITALASWLADRHASPGLASVALVGGFLTPVLTGGESRSPYPLLTYVGILIFGLMLLAHRHAWPLLNVASLFFTTVTLGAWASTSYRPEWYVVVEVYLTIYAAMYLAILRDTARAKGALAWIATWLLALTPLLYYGYSLLIVVSHPAALFVYLIFISVAGIILTGHFERPVWRLVLWGAAALPLVGWLSTAPAARWTTPALVTIAAIYALHLAAHFRALAERRSAIDAAELGVLHLNGLWVAAALYLLFDPRGVEWLASIPAGLAVWHAGLALWLRGRHDEAPYHYFALAAVLAAAGLTVARDGTPVTVGLAVEGAALAWLGLRAGREWVRLGGGLFLLVAIVRAARTLDDPSAVNTLVLLNERALTWILIIGLCYVLARQHAAAPRRDAYARDIAALVVGANVLTLLMLTSEIDGVFERASGYAVRPFELTGVSPATLAYSREITRSITWALYAVGLVVVGIVRAYRPLRFLAFLVFALTIAKVAILDLSSLDRLSQVLVAIALGVLLLVASYLYQRFRPGEREPVRTS